MKQTNEATVTVQSPWFKNWFDSHHYHRLYANRNETEAKNFIDNLLLKLSPAKDSLMIDVGCGAGRHCHYLASKGYKVTGIDTALSSIQQASKYRSLSLHFSQHDMREPFGNKCYDYVFNFFTSFGYFDSYHEHHEVIQNMATAVRASGTIVIDYLNVAYAEDRLVKEERKEIDGFAYYIKRWTDNTHFYKKIIIDDGFSQPFEYVEKVAKFTISDFRYMFYSHYLKVSDIYGDYNLNNYHSKQSPRLVMIVKEA